MNVLTTKVLLYRGKYVIISLIVLFKIYMVPMHHFLYNYITIQYILYIVLFKYIRVCVLFNWKLVYGAVRM